jgi:hypothetical protein
MDLLKKINKYKKKIKMIGGTFGEKNYSKNKIGRAAIAGINHYTEELIINYICDDKDILEKITKDTHLIYNAIMAYCNDTIKKINRVFDINIEEFYTIRGNFLHMFNHIWEKLFLFVKYATICTIYDLYYKKDESIEKFNLKIILYTDDHYLTNERLLNLNNIYKEHILPLTTNISSKSWFTDTLKKDKELFFIINYFCFFGKIDLPIYSKKTIDAENNRKYFSILQNAHIVQLNENISMIDKKQYFTKEELNNLNKFYDIDENIAIDIKDGIKYKGSNIYNLDIGKLKVFTPKNSEFYDHYYKTGFIVKGGPSGSILYLKQLYIFIKDRCTLDEKSFFLVIIIFMLIRGDHSLFEMMLTIPLKKEDGKYLGLFVNPENDWNDYTSKNAWDSFSYLISDSIVFKPIREIINSMNNYVSEIEKLD